MKMFYFIMTHFFKNQLVIRIIKKSCFLTVLIVIEASGITSPNETKNLSLQTSYNKTQLSSLSYWDNFKFSQIPILHAGRVKPLSTFAREYLLTLYEKSSLPDRSAEEWLIETLFDPVNSLNYPIFKIRNPEVIDILSLSKNKNNTYSFNELSKSLDLIIKQLNEIKNKPEEKRELIEQQLLSLYIKTHSYFELHHSLFMILPLFSLESPSLSKKLGMKAKQNYSLLEMVKFQKKIEREIVKLNPLNFKTLSEEEHRLILLSYRINALLKKTDNPFFKIIPPQWKENKDLWFSPWEIIGKGKGSPSSAIYMKNWKNMEKSYQKGDWKSAGDSAYQQALKISKGFANPILLFMEKIFNDIQFFKKSLVLYLFAFLSLLLSFICWKKWRGFFYKISFITLASGFILHLIGMIFRVIIMRRPPVSTLYESIVFVGLVVVGAALFLERHNLFYKSNSSHKILKDEDGVGILLGSLVGSVLHFISLKHKGAESMSLLVPVLNTNFWLATHVTCIAIGYACAIISSLMGHFYIFSKCFQKITSRPNHHPMDRLYRNMNSTVFFALFFCLFGTILGGIWADQSWGRFWGWDPKENGALAIVIWLLVLIHGKMSGILKEREFSAGMMLTNVIVALSWFGVNLLNVGLHSYGFVQGVLWGLILFCGGEILLTLSSYIYLRK